jgi:hypothetical protein
MIQCQFEVNSATVGKLRIGPLAAAAAQAAGTVLRKALLRDVAGGCVSAVRIEDVTHEFARIDGVRPELPRIVENLRACRVALRGAGPAVVCLVVDGPRTVTAADLASNPAVTAADPAQVIATVDAGSRLAVQVEITRGTGQECVERIQGRRPGWIEIDRHWCPVDRVAMNIDGPAGGATLVLEVVTDGTMGPAEAAVQAATGLQAAADLPEATRSLCRSVIAAAQAPTNRPVAAPARPAPSVRTINKTPTDAPIPDLIDVQRRSFEWFVQQTCPPAERQAHGLHRLLGEAFPATLASGEELAYVGYELDGPADDWRDCLRLGRTWAGALRLRLRRAGDGRPVIVDAGRLPLMTQRGTFVIDGREKVVLGRLQADNDTEANDLATRRLLMVGPQLQEALAGPLAADVRAAAKLDSSQGLALPAFTDAVQRFFARGRFVRQVEATNPLTLVSHLRRVVQCGVNKTPDYDARIAQANHFGRLCLLETPEGDSIGLNLNLAILAEIDEQSGQILAAYRRPSGGGVEHVPASAEANLCIGDLADEAGRARYGGRMLAKRGDQIVRVEPGEVELLPANAGLALGASASLIPLVAHDDANRALMGANMQKQAVALLSPEAPIVRTGMEARVLKALGPCPEGQIDLPASDGGVLALGRTVLVGYLSWEGYNFEDAIVVSDRLVRGGAFTSVKSLEFVATVARTAGAAAEAIGAGHLPAAEAAKLGPDGVVAEGTDVEGGDVLVARSVRVDGLAADGSPGGAPRRDASVRLPCGQRGTVVRVERYSLAKGDALAGGWRSATSWPIATGPRAPSRGSCRATRCPSCRTAGRST